jgi:hypothetical protein
MFHVEQIANISSCIEKKGIRRACDTENASLGSARSGQALDFKVHFLTGGIAAERRESPLIATNRY